ncbi:MAG TPA: hypothetical protein VK745_11600 [Polyangiaceae bacterium]|nr:hypothetical protein [Polyangiaceae bacterium]
MLPSAVTTTNTAAWQYEVALRGRELAVEASFDATNEESFELDPQTAQFAVHVESAPAGTLNYVPAASQGDAWRVACHAGCRVRYRFALGAAADALNDIDTAIASGDALLAPPSTWLLHPATARLGAQLEFHVILEPGARFESGFQRSASGLPESYVLPADALDNSSFTAFGQLQVAEVPAGDTTVRLAVAPQNLGLSLAEAVAWVSASAGAVAHYYQGHLPARHALVVLMKGSGTSTRGETLGGGGPAVLVRASDLVNPATTRDDWVVTHELLHVNFPDLGRQHAWLSEGLATYVEPVARARVGLVNDAKFWGDLVEGLPQGLPEAGDEGLENTHTWGRTYWGGALYCLMVDVTLRERTNNAHSLDDVLRGIAKTGDVDDVSWDIQQFLDAGQKATGTDVLRELYAALAEKPGTVNLSDLFARLGVHMRGDGVSFDDSAPLARIRRSITAH